VQKFAMAIRLKLFGFSMETIFDCQKVDKNGSQMDEK
jgi:hypothetical protein